MAEGGIEAVQHRADRRGGVHQPVISILTILAVLLAPASGAAQETRGSVFGIVRDASGAVLTGIPVVVTNEETNVATASTTNDRGAYEVPYLLPGSYRVVVDVSGMKKFTQTGLPLSVNNRVEVNVSLEVGTLTDEVTVVARAPLLDTTASAATTLTNREVNALPMFGNSALLLARSVPGVQWTGQPNYLGLHSNIGASAVSGAGGVGGTEFSLDGVPNAGPSRRAAYLPYTDTVDEIKIETAGFDASKGHTSGINVSMISKSGTNQFRGSGTWQYWNQKWNAVQSTTNAAYWGRINQAIADGRLDDAARYRSEPKVPPGHHHNWAGVLGGPVTVPRLFQGADRLFFFFSYNGFKDEKVEEPTNVNRTVPTEAQRRGDFSDLLRIDPVRYQIYDPRTARLVNGHVVRDPFPNNQVPILNPVYQAYLRLFPLPNNPSGVVSREGQNNYLASATPFNWDYAAFSNRIDWKVSERHRSFVRWSYNSFLEDRGDWTYETARGLHSNGLVRKNFGATIDHVFLQNARTIWNVSIAFNRFTEGNERNAVQRSFSPGAVGLPAYLDDRANASPCTMLPVLDFSDGSYTDFGLTCGGFTSYSIGTLRGEMTKLLGTHSVKSGVDLRMHWRSNIPGGNTSATFTFRNNYVRQRDDTNNAGTLGLEWASFMLGVPTAISIDTNDSYALTNPYYAAYLQDDWRLNERLTLNLGLRYEIEGGFVEQYDRGIGGGFDFGEILPITAAAEAAYLRNPIAGVPSIDVRGGNTYLGADGAPRSLSDSQQSWMPRVGVVAKLGQDTTLRAGYGLFFDTNNVLNDGINQFGYSRSTNTILTNDTGLTFLNTNLTSPACQANPAACQTIFSDPFPVRADGTRFNEPLGNALGSMARVGRGLDYVDRDWRRARQQRWRVGVQRALSRTIVVEAAHLGSFTDNISLTRRLDFLPGQYWASGLVRDDATATYLNALIPNPFSIANFDFLRTQNPILYQDMANNGFFTSTTIRRHQLLRAYSQMSTGNGLRNLRTPDGEAKYRDVELSVQQRLSRGIQYTVSYTRAWNDERDFYADEFDPLPTWRESDNSLPHHFFVTAIAELPFGPGKPWLASGWGRTVLGGWQIAGVYHLQSGRTIDWGNRFYYGSSYDDIALPASEQTREHWFNTANFERNSALQPASFHRRVFPSRIDGLRADYMNQLDLSLQRQFALGGHLRFQARLDAINALNRVQWDRPNTDPTSSNFGVVTQQWNTPRWLQLQGRMTF
jgi:outer membrane receptor protein involved in Fe transport